MLVGCLPQPLVSRRGWRRSLGWRPTQRPAWQRGAEVGSVVDRVPVANLDCGDANHDVLFVDARSLRQRLPYCVNLHQLTSNRLSRPRGGRPGEANRPSASSDRAAPITADPEMKAKVDRRAVGAERPTD